MRDIIIIISILVLTFSVVNAQSISNESHLTQNKVYLEEVANHFVDSYHVEYFELVSLDKDKDFKYIFPCNGKEYVIYPFFMYKNRPIYTKAIFLKEGIAFEFTPQSYFPVPKENDFEFLNESISEFSNKMLNSGNWLCIGYFSIDDYGERFQNIISQEGITQEVRFVYYNVLLNKPIENLAKKIAKHDYQSDKKAIYYAKMDRKNESILEGQKEEKAKHNSLIYTVIISAFLIFLGPFFVLIERYKNRLKKQGKTGAIAYINYFLNLPYFGIISVPAFIIKFQSKIPLRLFIILFIIQFFAGCIGLIIALRFKEPHEKEKK